MSNSAGLDTFRAGSAIHLGVIVATALAAVVLASVRRRLRARPAGRTLDHSLATLAAIAWVGINARQLLYDDFSSGTALPLHVSDLTMFVVPIALWTQQRWSRAIVYYWGLALGSLAFIIPDLRDGPAKIGFWLFWLNHGLMMIAIAYDLIGRGYRPGWRDCAIASVAAILYAAAVVPFNAVTGHSYGYLGPDHPGQPALLTSFGTWPARVAPILLTAIAIMAVLTVPWTLGRKLK